MRDRGFYQTFRRRAPGLIAPGGGLLVAVSGGPDSVCLLHLAVRIGREKGLAVAAAHVRHHLRRGDSDLDRDFVRSLSRDLGTPFLEREGRLPPGRKRSIEELARKLRYRALGDLAMEWGARTLWTAHHADDQAETLLLNLMRGAGPDGLSGILPERSLDEVTGRAADASLTLARPLLPFGRGEILAYLKSQGLKFRLDRSNLSLEFRRNWVRKKLLPAMREVQPAISGILSATAGIFARERRFADADFGRMSARLLGDRAGAGRGESLDLERFFEYDMGSRLQFLHRLLPKFSGREIERAYGHLERAWRRRLPVPSLPISDLIPSRGPGRPALR
ncbi:MAG: tRNA lysidine(34) synthetase TilS [Elusimicrobia bacterium RIFCSPHIGHO2_01_FULL_64_10]|nr:MAG: tRNA lysidine(34) synthetase TilS [Elusimicrobia bacterium RIFCSPHIGHO2_01_FULL_64_10]